MESTIMELDDLKSAWQSLDRRLQLDNRLRLQEYRERTADRIRGNLRPLFWGQVAQMLFGIVVMLMGAACWARHMHIAPLLVSGLVMHAYGLLVVILSGSTLGMLRGVDFSQPVITIQGRLAKLQRRQFLGGSIAGLSWWVLWIPMLLVVAGLGAFNMQLPEDAMPIASWVWFALGVGMAGLLGIAGVYRWSGTPGHERLRRKLDDMMVSPSLREAQARMDELAQFEQE